MDVSKSRDGRVHVRNSGVKLNGINDYDKASTERQVIDIPWLLLRFLGIL